MPPLKRGHKNYCYLLSLNGQTHAWTETLHTHTLLQIVTTKLRFCNIKNIIFNNVLL